MLVVIDDQEKCSARVGPPDERIQRSACACDGNASLMVRADGWLDFTSTLFNGGCLFPSLFHQLWTEIFIHPSTGRAAAGRIWSKPNAQRGVDQVIETPTTTTTFLLLLFPPSHRWLFYYFGSTTKSTFGVCVWWLLHSSRKKRAFQLRQKIKPARHSGNLPPDMEAKRLFSSSALCSQLEVFWFHLISFSSSFAPSFWMIALASILPSTTTTTTRHTIHSLTLSLCPVRRLDDLCGTCNCKQQQQQQPKGNAMTSQPLATFDYFFLDDFVTDFSLSPLQMKEKEPFVRNCQVLG